MLVTYPFVLISAGFIGRAETTRAPPRHVKMETHLLPHPIRRSVHTPLRVPWLFPARPVPRRSLRGMGRVPGRKTHRSVRYERSKRGPIDGVGIGRGVYGEIEERGGGEEGSQGGDV